LYANANQAAQALPNTAPRAWCRSSDVLSAQAKPIRSAGYASPGKASLLSVPTFACRSPSPGVGPGSDVAAAPNYWRVAGRQAEEAIWR